MEDDEELEDDDELTVPYGDKIDPAVVFLPFLLSILVVMTALVTEAEPEPELVLSGQGPEPRLPS